MAHAPAVEPVFVQASLLGTETPRRTIGPPVYFASGSNSPGEIRGLAGDLRHPIGVEITEVNEWDAHLSLLLRVLRPGGRAYVAVRTDDACDGSWRKATSRGWQVCRDPRAWQAYLAEHLADVELFDRGSGYVTFVGIG